MECLIRFDVFKFVHTTFGGLHVALRDRYIASPLPTLMTIWQEKGQNSFLFLPALLSPFLLQGFLGAYSALFCWMLAFVSNLWRVLHCLSKYSMCLSDLVTSARMYVLLTGLSRLQLFPNIRPVYKTQIQNLVNYAGS